MTSSLTRQQQKTPCVSCSHPLEPLAKFCGECGTTVESLSSHNSSIPLESAFAQVAKRMGIEPGSVQAQVHTGPFPAQNVTGGFPAQNVTGNFPAQNTTGNFPAQNSTVGGAQKYSNIQPQVSNPYNAPRAVAGSYGVPAQQQAVTNSYAAMSAQQQQAVTNSYAAMSAQQQQAVTNSYAAMSAQQQAMTNSYAAMSPQASTNSMPAAQQKMTGSFNGMVSAQGGQQVPQHAPNGVPSGFVQDKYNNPQYTQQSLSQPLPQQSLSQPLPQQVVIPNTVSYDDLAKLEAYRLSQISGTQMNWAPTPSANPRGNTVPLPPTGGAPTFARLNSGTNGGVSPALVSEMESLNASLIRERVFLIMHCAIFLVTNLVGFYLAMTCYYGIHGDEVTKLVMALTPLTFINFVALSCLAPIKGTRREIARLLEKKQYVQFQMEYSNLMR